MIIDGLVFNATITPIILYQGDPLVIGVESKSVRRKPFDFGRITDNPSLLILVSSASAQCPNQVSNSQTQCLLAHDTVGQPLRKSATEAP